MHMLYTKRNPYKIHHVLKTCWAPEQETSVRDGVSAAKQLIMDGFQCPLSEALASFSETHEERSFQKNLCQNLRFVNLTEPISYFWVWRYEEPQHTRVFPGGSVRIQGGAETIVQSNLSGCNSTIARTGCCGHGMF